MCRSWRDRRLKRRPRWGRALRSRRGNTTWRAICPTRRPRPTWRTAGIPPGASTWRRRGRKSGGGRRRGRRRSCRESRWCPTGRRSRPAVDRGRDSCGSCCGQTWAAGGTGWRRPRPWPGKRSRCCIRCKWWWPVPSGAGKSAASSGGPSRRRNWSGGRNGTGCASGWWPALCSPRPTIRWRCNPKRRRSDWKRYPGADAGNGSWPAEGAGCGGLCPARQKSLESWRSSWRWSAQSSGTAVVVAAAAAVADWATKPSRPSSRADLGGVDGDGRCWPDSECPPCARKRRERRGLGRCRYSPAKPRRAEWSSLPSTSTLGALPPTGTRVRWCSSCPALAPTSLQRDWRINEMIRNRSGNKERKRESKLTDIVERLENGFLPRDGVGQQKGILLEAGEQGGGRSSGVLISLLSGVVMRVGRLVIGRSRRWRRRRRDRGGIGGGRRSQTEISPGQRLRRAEQTGTGSDDTLHQFRDDGFALSPIGECLQVGGHLHGHLPEKTGGGHHVATVKRLGMRHLGQIIGDGNDGIAFADTRVQARQPDGLAFAQVRRWREPRRPRSFTSRPGAEPSSVASRAARTGLYDVIARSSPVPVESSRYSRLTVHVVIATRWPWFVVVWRRPRSQTTASSCEKKEEKNNNVSVAGAIVTLERDVFSFEISLDDFLLYFEFIYIFSSLSLCS